RDDSRTTLRRERSLRKAGQRVAEQLGLVAKVAMVKPRDVVDLLLKEPELRTFYSEVTRAAWAREPPSRHRMRAIRQAVRNLDAAVLTERLLASGYVDPLLRYRYDGRGNV